MIKDTRRNVVTMNEKEYYNLIKPYEDAMQMILSRLDTLNHTLYESSATQKKEEVYEHFLEETG